MRADDPSRWVEGKYADSWNAYDVCIERAENGLSKADWINFDTYIAWVIANAVKRFRDEGNTAFYYPNEPEENWEALTHGEYEVMIEGFGGWASKSDLETHEEEASAVAKLEDALEIFKNRFKSLWD
jgi:hypothetical protein